MPPTFIANKAKVELFKMDLLKPVITKEVRDWLPELIAGEENDLMRAAERVLVDILPKIDKFCESMSVEEANSFKLVCAAHFIADFNIVFPADYSYALAVVFLDDQPGVYNYVTVDREEVSQIDTDDDQIRAPVIRSATQADFEAGRRKLYWIVNKK